MFQRFGHCLFQLRDLQPGHVAERDAPGDEWLTSPYEEDSALTCPDRVSRKPPIGRAAARVSERPTRGHGRAAC